MSEHRYRLLWKVASVPAGVVKAAIPPDCGGADAALVASIIYPADGSMSVSIVGLDGRSGGDLSDAERFKVWSMLARSLMDSRTLSPEKREVVEAAFGAVQRMVQRDRKKGSA